MQQTLRNQRPVTVLIGRVQVRKCETCAHVGPDVLPTLAHVGGRGYVTVVTCQNPAECWGRWDRVHGLEVR